MTRTGYTGHALVAFGGHVGVSPNQDSWQCGIRVATLSTLGRVNTLTNDFNLTNPATYMNAIATPLKNWFATASATTAGSEFMGLRTDSTLEWLKVNNIAAGPVGKGLAGGTYLNKTSSNTYVYPTAQGGVSVAGIPFIITAAVSLTTAQQRGPGHRGRIYLPFAFPTMGAAVINTTQQTQCNGSVRALLSVLATPTDGPGNLPVRPVIASQVDGGLVPITGVATGSVIDVQRRRKEQIAETYVSHVWP